MNRLSEKYKEVIYKLLMTTNGRTTDLLEVLSGEEVQLIVKEQWEEQEVTDTGKLFTYLVRESYMVTRETETILSHNFAKVYPSFIPQTLTEKVTDKKEGIGSSMKRMDLLSTRRILTCGWRDAQEIIDLGMNKKGLIFGTDDKVPFKEYEVCFEQNGHPGIHLLEYFNPNILNYLEKTSESVAVTP
ncbi:hypothetical protein ASG66_02135 [Bacillus sp. Leaf406]|nr:hypothetical protein ASG66_02135 [Bacillus sp. Leaf406]